MDVVREMGQVDSDEALAGRVCSGDRMAWEQLYLRHEPELRTLVARFIHDRHAVDDIVQDAFIDLWCSADKYDDSRPFLPYMRAVCRYRAWNYRRSVRRQGGGPLPIIDELLQVADDEAAQAADERAAALLSALQNCLQTLDEERRGWLRMRYAERLDLASIAAQIGRSVDATAQAIKRVRDVLRRCCDKRLRAP